MPFHDPGAARASRARAARHALLPLVLASAPALAAAQAPSDAGWQACARTAEAGERLACFDRWAATQGAPAVAAPATPATPPAAPTSATTTALKPALPEGCRDPANTALSRFWELDPPADCGTFGIRGYRPISLAIVAADTVNRQPTSDNPLNNATTSQSYSTKEMRLQLSVRTKLAKDLLTGHDPSRSDSLWFGYSQQSYWQLFNGGLSRPFRSTDHEPEVVYVLPLQPAQADRWRLRYAGVGWVHQSNGQSLPLSRSWNRTYLMAGAERGDWRLLGRVWRRTAESGGDDNPSIGAWVGRGELTAQWDVNPDNMLAATLRHSLSSTARGSVRLEWYRTLGGEGAAVPGGLKLHTQLFSGYGDSLLDYNRRRSVFSVGLSLVEW